MQRKKNSKKYIKKETFIKELPPNPVVTDYLVYGLGVLWAFLIQVFGILCGLSKAFVTVLCAAIVSFVLIATVGYAKIKPQLDTCREIAYDKLAQMKRSDFSMLSDTEVYDNKGNMIGLINAGHYEYASIDAISLNIQNAYIAQEDRRFKSHSGVDFLATMRAGLALVKNNGEITQGASTITQQVIKNTYLSQEQTFTRKITEILLAPDVEKKYSKADIMEFYCNTNFYGNRCYGIQAASRYYFAKDASDLEVWEAATLAGISNSPSRYDPVKHPSESIDKRNSVLKSMEEVEFITQEEYSKAIEKPLGVVQETQEGTDENYMVSYAIHCAALELMKADGFEFKYTYENRDDFLAYDEKYKEVYTEKSELIRSGGYKLYTALDIELQSLLQGSVDNGLAKFTELQENGKYAMQGAAVTVDNNTGYVVAIVGGRGTEDQFNRAYLSARQPGSTIKPLIDYAPAFDTGEYFPSKIMNDHKWDDGPKNSGSYYGNVTVREAITRSLNTVAWQVLQGIGVDKGLDYLGKMQFQKMTYVDNGVESLSIGGFTHGLRVVDMAKGYSTLANYGEFIDNTCILEVRDMQDKNVIANNKHQTKQVFTQDTAYMLTDILKGVVSLPQGTGYGLALNNGQIAAGKTGTTNSNKDTWFCGYTRDYTTSVWVGYDTPRAMYGIFGATYAGRIWKNAMDAIISHTGVEAKDWDRPGTVIESDYKASTGEKSATSTGVSDLFSTSAEVLAEQTDFERSQRLLADKLEVQVQAYENWNVATVEDTYLFSTKTNEIRSQVAELESEELRKPLMERVQDRYTELSKVVSDMQDVVKLYEQQKEQEAEEAKKLAEKEAEVKRKQFEKDARLKDFNDALKAITTLTHQALNAEQLCKTAETKLELLVDDTEYNSSKDSLLKAIDNIKTLPTKEEWDKMEAERLRLEAEEAARKAEEQRLLLEQQEKELQERIEREKAEWNKKQEIIEIGPGMNGGATGPGSVSRGGDIVGR